MPHFPYLIWEPRTGKPSESLESGLRLQESRLVPPASLHGYPSLQPSLAPISPKRGKEEAPRALAGCGCGCCPATQKSKVLRARAPRPSDPLGAPVVGDSTAPGPGPASYPRLAPGRRLLMPGPPRGAPHLLASVEQTLALGPYVEQRPHPLAQLLDGGFARNVLDGARLGAVDGADLDPHRGTGTGDRPSLSGPALGPPRPARPPPPPLEVPLPRGCSASAGAREDCCSSPRDRPPLGGGRKPEPARGA